MPSPSMGAYHAHPLHRPHAVARAGVGAGPSPHRQPPPRGPPAANAHFHLILQRGEGGKGGWGKARKGVGSAPDVHVGSGRRFQTLLSARNSPNPNQTSIRPRRLVCGHGPSSLRSSGPRLREASANTACRSRGVGPQSPTDRTRRCPLRSHQFLSRASFLRSEKDDWTCINGRPDEKIIHFTS